MDKAYNRIIWTNEPDVSTPLSAANLNKMDAAIDTVDDRIIAADISKANQSDLLQCIKGVTYNTETGVFVFTWQNGSVLNVDLAVEKIPVSMSMSADGIITMITADGTKFTCNVKDLIKGYQFVESEQIHFAVSTDSDGNYSIAASIKDGTITGNKLEPDYLANVTVQAQNAVASASNAAQSANSAAASAETAQTWAEQAESIVGIDIATTEKAGLVKPSERVTVADNGTMDVNLQDMPVLSSSLMTKMNSGDDLNIYLTPGRYFCASGGVAETLINTPDIDSGFYLDVYEWAAGNVSQVIEQWHNNIRYKRARIVGTWKEWEKVPQRAEITDIDNKIGSTDISSLGDGTLTGAVSQCFQSVSDGKSLIASAITDKGVATTSDATFAEMAEHIGEIVTDTSEATVSRLSGTATVSTTGTELKKTFAVEAGKTYIAVVTLCANAGGYSSAYYNFGQPNVTGNAAIEKIKSQTTPTTIVTAYGPGNTDCLCETNVFKIVPNADGEITFGSGIHKGQQYSPKLWMHVDIVAI